VGYNVRGMSIDAGRSCARVLARDHGVLSVKVELYNFDTREFAHVASDSS